MQRLSVFAPHYLHKTHISPRMANSCTPLSEENTTHLNPSQPGPWLGPPDLARSFLPLPYDTVRAPPLRPRTPRLPLAPPWLPLRTRTRPLFVPSHTQAQQPPTSRSTPLPYRPLPRIPPHRLLYFNLHHVTSSRIFQLFPCLETEVVLDVAWARRE